MVQQRVRDGCEMNVTRGGKSYKEMVMQKVIKTMNNRGTTGDNKKEKIEDKEGKYEKTRVIYGDVDDGFMA